MKFSDGLILDNESAGMQQTIEKLTEKSSPSQLGKVVKIKKEFMHSVVDSPEFNQTVTELSHYTTEHGSQTDKGQIANIQRKIVEGNLDYDDVLGLNSIAQKNFKYFFKKEPAVFVFDPATAIGFSLTILAVIIRWTSDGSISAATITFLASINLIAIIYTSCLWPNNVVSNLNSWMADNAVPDIISKKLIRPVSKKVWKIVGCFVLFAILVLVIVSFFKNFALGNDNGSKVLLLQFLYCRWRCLDFEHGIFQHVL